jgi:hypothetical protein
MEPTIIRRCRNFDFSVFWLPDHETRSGDAGLKAYTGLNKRMD